VPVKITPEKEKSGGERGMRGVKKDKGLEVWGEGGGVGCRVIEGDSG
jgi:hypothetical protein